MYKNLVEIFFEAAKLYPTNSAIIFSDRNITYESLAEQVKATAEYLRSKGIKKSTKVLVFIPMSIKLYQTVLALFSIGAIVVFVDEWSDRERLKKALQVVDVDAIISLKKYIWLAYLLKPFRQISIKLSIPHKLTKEDSLTESMNPNDTALITFTTGSTGLPKAANRTHHFLSEQFRILKNEIGAVPEDKCLISLPIVLLSILGTGATGIVTVFNQKKPETFDAEYQLDMIKHQDINIIIASPFLLEKLAKVPQRETPKLKLILTGGAPVFPNLAQKINASFPNSLNRVAYGSTEAEPISTIEMKQLESYSNITEYGIPVGKINSEIQLKIIKISPQPIELSAEGWKEWELTNEQMGEIIVSGPHVLDSYFNSEKAFKYNKIVDGNKIWHRTGDCGRNIANELFLQGRCNQVIKYEDKFLSPFIIENQLAELNEVEIGTIIEIDNKIKIIVELAFTTDKLKLQQKLTALSIPFHDLYFIDKMPRDRRHFSKIDYEKLTTYIKLNKIS